MDSTIASPGVEVMHPDADRRLIVGTDSQVTFAVCASAMSMASPVWRCMFKAPDASAAYTWRDPTFTELKLDEDDPNAFRVVLLAVHYRFEDLEDLDVSGVKSLASIAALSDKYDVARIIKPWMQPWIAKAARYAPPSQENWNDFTVPWFNIAYVFKNEDILRKTIRCIGREVELEKIHGINDVVEVRGKQRNVAKAYMLKDMIPDITAALKAIGSHTARELFFAVTKTMKDTIETGRHCSHGRVNCNMVILGRLVSAMTRSSLFCLPAFDSATVTIESPPIPFHGSAFSLLQNLRAVLRSNSEDICSCGLGRKRLENQLERDWQAMTAKLDKLCDALVANKRKNGKPLEGTEWVGL